VKNWRTLAALCAGALSYNKKKISRAEHSRTNYSLGDFKDSAIILDGIRQSFLTKSATAAVFTSV
jgi:hypothetical protein